MNDITPTSTTSHKVFRTVKTVLALSAIGALAYGIRKASAKASVEVDTES